VPSNKALVVTSITLHLLDEPVDPVTVVVNSGLPDYPCVWIAYLGQARFDGAGIETIAFPSGLVIGPGHTLDLNVYSLGVAQNPYVVSYVDGYWVPSAQCSVNWSAGSPAGCV
jgi:hypothetical protein